MDQFLTVTIPEIFPDDVDDRLAEVANAASNNYTDGFFRSDTCCNCGCGCGS